MGFKPIRSENLGARGKDKVELIPLFTCCFCKACPPKIRDCNSQQNFLDKCFNIIPMVLVAKKISGETLWSLCRYSNSVYPLWLLVSELGGRADHPRRWEEEAPSRIHPVLMVHSSVSQISAWITITSKNFGWNFSVSVLPFEHFFCGCSLM